MTTIARMPPQNIEAEQAVLGTMILKEVMPNNLSAEMFYKDSHRIIFSAILDLSNDGKNVDLVTLSSYLRDQNSMDQIGGVVYLVTLTNIVPSVSQLESYAEIVKNKAALRKVIGASNEAMQLSYEEQGDLLLILAGLQGQIDATYAMLKNSIHEKMDMDLSTLLDGFHAKETHLDCLNRIIGGLPSDVIMTAGATSMGKTSFSLGVLRKLAIEDGERVAYFGSGVKKEEIYLRLLCSMGSVDPKLLRRGKILEEQRKMLERNHAIINSAPISIFTMSEKMLVMDIVAKTRALVLQEEDKIGAVIIENLQQLVWHEPIKARKTELDLIFSCLKALALDLDIPIIISSQVVREVSLREDKRPKPTDLLGTSDIEGLARLILILYWDDYYHPENNAKDLDGFVPAEIIVYKTGPPTTLSLKFNPTFFIWKDKEK